MTAQEIDRFRRIEAIFDATLELAPGAERDAFLLGLGAMGQRSKRYANCWKAMRA
jgi:hypothetical protein